MKSCPTTPVKEKKVPRDVLFSPGKLRSTKTNTAISKSVKEEISQSLFETRFSSASVKANEAVKKMYKTIHKATGALGGNGSTGAIYGEITIGSMQRLIDFMVEECELNTSSIFMDVGSGLGKPNFHAAISPGVRLSVGIELEDIRYRLCLHNQKAMLACKDLNAQCVNFMVGDIDIATTLDPITHVYQYDLGFPPPLQKSIAVKFNTSQHCKYLISYRPPHRVIEEYGYAVTFVDQILTSMTGSGEGHTAYFYKRNNTPPALSAKEKKNGTATTKLLTLPARPQHPEDPAEGWVVYCDVAFYECCRLAAGLDGAELTEYVNRGVEEHLTAERPKRERKQRVISEATM